MVTPPGYAPYTLTSSGTSALTDPPTCATVDRLFRRTIRVEQWALPRGGLRARPGRTLRVTKPVAPGARVRYEWFVDSTRVARTRSLRVRRAWAGRGIRLTLRFTQAGRSPVRETVYYRR